MAAEAICDGCEKRAPMEYFNGSWHKPRSWFERSDKNGPQTACSRECVDKIAAATGKTGVILPF